MNKMRTAGWLLMVLGVLMLVSGVICAITIGTVAVQLLLSGSIVVNSVGVSLLRWKKTKR